MGWERITIGDPEEIPELVRVFCLDHNNCPDNCSTEDQQCNDFDYKAVTELLWKDPEQVRYVTYECKARHSSEIRDSTRSNNHGKYDHNGSDNARSQAGRLSLHSPLRWACIETTKEAEAMEFLKAVREIDPTRFLLQDSHGDLPIDGECVLNASLELLSFLMEIYLDYDFVCPNGVVMTEANFNPINCLCGSYWWEDIHQANEKILSGTYIVSGTNVLEDNLGIEDIFWEKIILLAKAFYHKTIDEDYDDDDDKNIGSPGGSSSSMLRITNEHNDRRVKFRLLHACAGIDWFPINLLQLLVAAFPGTFYEADEDGNLPIHVAAGAFFETYRINANWEGRFEANSGYQSTTLDVFLEVNPDLARIPDAEGRLPLELAIETIHQHPHRRWRHWEDGGIGSLLQAYPEAVSLRSPVTGNLPLEITLGRGSYWDWEEGIEVLLQAYPEAAGLKNPQTGKFPLQLAIERETHFDDGVYALLAASTEAVWIDVGRFRSRETPEAHKLPLFAYAALENCSSSVVYTILRAFPESCRNNFQTNNNNNNNCHKRKQQQGLEETGKKTTTSLLPSSCDDSPSNKRCKSLSYATTTVPPKVG